MPTARSMDVLPANPGAGFHFPYILRAPAAPHPGFPFLLVETNNGPPSPRFADHVGEAIELSLNGLGGNVSRTLGAPLLMPIFAREEGLYTFSLGRDVMLEGDGPLRRLDLQLLAMIRDAQARLKGRGFALDAKVMLTGFSASAMFATRFTAIHPGAVQALAAGGLNGFVILPLFQLQGQELTYPVGIADLEHIAGDPFDRTAWNRVPQFLFMGELDSNDAVEFDDSYSAQHRSLIHELVGRRMMPDRWLACERLYAEAGAPARFKTYAKLGHGTNSLVHAEVAAFLAAKTKETT